MSDQRLLAPTDGNLALSESNRASAISVPPQHLRHTVRSESTKIKSLRASWVVPVVAGAFVSLIVVLSMAFAEDPARASVAKTVIQVLQIPIIAIAAFVTSTITTEYGHETIRVTYTATPRRGRACAGRYLAALGYAIASSVAVTLFAMLIGTAVLWIRGVHYSPAAPLVGSIALMLVVGVITALAGLSIGYLIPHTAAAVTLVAAYIFVEQTMFGILIFSRWEWLLKWFPFSAAWDAALGTQGNPDDKLVTLGRPMGIVYYAALVAILMALAIRRELRRDA